MKIFKQKESKQFQKLIIFGTIGIILSVILLLFGLMGFSSGYGRVIDGELVLLRRPLAQIMTEDYAKDGGEWGFGYFVPVAVVGLFWFRRRQLLKMPVRPALVAGSALLVLGFSLYWLGFRGEQKYLGYAGGQIIFAGAILWFLGWIWFRGIFWLWMLLGMMWPWRLLIEPISAPLQGLLAKLTAGFLKLSGVGALSSGSSVSTDTRDPVTSNFISLDIDVACSGMRSLFALIMIGMVFAFLRVKDEWKRWVLMIFVPLIAVAGNFVRMLLLYGGSRVWGTGFAIGEQQQMSPYHMLAGLAVFAVALVLMSLVVEMLDKGKRFFKRGKVVRKSVRQKAINER